ncbi:MAG: DUF1836 domain-containing protein [Eubacteriales bacterium]|nr:DUF1836 domain-containing protein [Eubacteriales bacterium]
MRRELEEIFLQFPTIRTADIPGIDLYMDQVTTFLQENLRGLSRDPEGDKFLTKTMINNYVKNKVLIPPVKKKYSREHMMLLIMIYYMKSFLSIGDIRSITGPVTEHYAASPVPRSSDRKREAAKKEPVKKEPAKREAAQKAEAGTGMPGPEAAPALGIADIYESVIENFSSELPLIREGILRQIELAADDFAGVPEEERPLLQRFSLICRLSAEVYIRKLFIEKLLDADL